MSKFTREHLLNVHDVLSKDARSIMDLKNQDYGAERDVFLNFRMTEAMGLAPTETGILIRMADKISRIRSFIENGEMAVDGEGLRDAVLDIVNYGILIWAIQVEKNLVSKGVVDGN